MFESEDNEALLHEASSLERQSRFEPALAILELLLTRLPEAERPWVQTSRILVSLGRTEEAEELLLKAQTHAADQPAVFIALARIAEQRRDWSETSKRWEVVRDRFPNQVAAWTAGAASLGQSGATEEADVLLTEALALFPREPGVAFAWANAPAWRGDVLVRVSRWEHVLKDWPEHPGAYAAGALALRDAGYIDRAELVALEGVTKFPHVRDVHRAYGAVMLKAGKLDAADEALQKAITIDPNDATTHIYLIDTAIALNDYQSAMVRVETAKEKFPDNRYFENMARSVQLRQEQTLSLERAVHVDDPPTDSIETPPTEPIETPSAYHIETRTTGPIGGAATSQIGRAAVGMLRRLFKRGIQ